MPKPRKIVTGVDKEGHPRVLNLKDEDVTGGIFHYRETGVKQTRLGRFDQAIKDLDVAYNIDEECWRTVVMRARAAMRGSRYQEALDGARMALKADHEDIDALLIEARTLYNMGEFEKALMIAHRGWKKRKMPPVFADIIFAAEETIEDCIGRNVGPIMLEFLDLIYEMEKEHEREEILASQRLDDPCVFPDDNEDDDSALGNKEQRQCRARLEAYMCSKYLELLCHDHRFMVRINTPTALAGPNMKTVDGVLELAAQGIDFLHKKQEMLRERMPLYSIRYREAVHSSSVRRRRKKMLEKKREVVRATALSQLEALRKARMEKDFKKFFYTLERCYEFLSKQTKNILPQKRDFQDGLYNLAGIGYLDIMTLRREDSEDKRKLQAQMIVGVRTPHGTAIDSVLSGSMTPCIDRRRRLETDEQRLKGSDSHLERAWIYWDMCYQSVETRRFDMVRFYGRKCVAEAKYVRHWAWCINAIILISKSEMQQNNRAEAVHALNEAVEFAQKLKNELVHELLLACMKVIRLAPPDVTIEPRKARENKIIDMMMGDEMIDQAKVLLKCIEERERARIAGMKRTAKLHEETKRPKKKDEAGKEDQASQGTAEINRPTGTRTPPKDAKRTHIRISNN